MSDRERLFFALWPSEALRKQLVNETRRGLRSCGGRPVPFSNIHLTLVFLGSVSRRQRECLENAAESVEVNPFALELQRWEYWRRPRVVGCRPAEIPDALEGLVTQLRVSAKACGVDVESRPFTPHVTLMRKAQRGPHIPLHEPLHWPVVEFSLVRSQTLPEGAHYESVGTWGLHG